MRRRAPLRLSVAWYAHTAAHNRRYSHYPYVQIPRPTLLTNLHQPGSPLSMVSEGMMVADSSPHGFRSASYSPQYVPQERPFKCDVCPQGFTRNHDLKRHRRIHLSAKPFPCLCCGKPFSRRDALKVRDRSDFLRFHRPSTDADSPSRGTYL